MHNNRLECSDLFGGGAVVIVVGLSTFFPEFKLAVASNGQAIYLNIF